MTDKTGGPAFPVRWPHLDEQTGGMTLRDYFAAAALTGYLAAGNTGGWSNGLAAEKAYSYADAMLKERAK